MRLKASLLTAMIFPLFFAQGSSDTIRPSGHFIAGEDGQPVRHLPARLAEARPANRGLASDPTTCPDSLDMLHYELHINVLRATTTLEGTALLTFESTKAGLTGAQLDLRALTVSAITQSGTPLAYTQSGDTLLVTLDSPAALGDTVTIEITYAGVPENEGSFGGFWFFPFPPTDFTMGVGLDTDPPSMGRYWFPGVDAPCDKATSELFIEIPGNKNAVANGVLVSTVTDTVTGRKTYQWREDHQIATYLMAFSVAKYSTIADTANSLINYHVYRTDTALALPTFQNVHHMMDAFELLFGPYPYDTFSFVTTPLGDMEHQTCVFHQAGLMTGDTTYDDILAHELCHMWFGNLVTYGDWRDVWLSEGFASYGEALFHEHLYGTANYHWYVASALMGPYLGNSGNLTYPIYDPDFKWGTVVYEKGGVVLHMLRRVMGDTAFFAAMNAYLDNHEYGNATTPDFQAVCDAAYGSSLDWFFNEWIYSGGHPVFDWSWESADLGGGSYSVTVETRQVQAVGPIYTMPVDFRIETASGDTTVTGWVNSQSNSLSFTVEGEPTAVLFDPDNWLLDQHSLVPTTIPDAVPARFRLEANRPNPFNPVTLIPFEIDTETGVYLEIFSAGGRQVRSLLQGDRLPAGEHMIQWDGTDFSGRAVSSGVYFYRIQAGDRSETRKMQLVR